jgi:hypothetical protein
MLQTINRNCIQDKKVQTYRPTVYDMSKLPTLLKRRLQTPFNAMGAPGLYKGLAIVLLLGFAGSVPPAI